MYELVFMISFACGVVIGFILGAFLMPLWIDEAVQRMNGKKAD